jgi:hypothetical protein
MFDRLKQRLNHPEAQGDMRMARGLGTVVLLSGEVGAVMAYQAVEAQTDPRPAATALTVTALAACGAYTYLKDALDATRPDQG